MFAARGFSREQTQIYTAAHTSLHQAERHFPIHIDLFLSFSSSPPSLSLSQNIACIHTSLPRTPDVLSISLMLPRPIPFPQNPCPPSFPTFLGGNLSSNSSYSSIQVCTQPTQKSKLQLQQDEATNDSARKYSFTLVVVRRCKQPRNAFRDNTCHFM